MDLLDFVYLFLILRVFSIFFGNFNSLYLLELGFIEKCNICIGFVLLTRLVVFVSLLIFFRDL